jgi:hypothetical protein
MSIVRRPHVRFALAVLLATGLAGSAAHGAAPAEGPDVAPGTGDPSVAAFEALRERVAAEAREGRLPAETAARAEEIGFSLETALIRADADIQVALLEARRFSGERQEAALTRLVQAVAGRERQIFHHLRRLEEAAGMSAPPMVPETAEAPAEGASNAGSKSKKSKIDIEFKAEDLTKDPVWPR